MNSTEDQTAHLIRNLGELRGHVRIANPTAALSFVRMMTSFSNYQTYANAGHDRTMEVIRESDVTAETSNRGPGPDQLHIEAAKHEGASGIISDKLADRLGIPSTVASISENGFVITRAIIINKNIVEPPTIFRIMEWVGRDGEYKEIRREPVVLPSHIVLWRPFTRNM